MSSSPLAPLTFTYRTIPSSFSTSTSTAAPPLHLHLDVHLPPPTSSSNLATTPTPIPLIFAAHPGGLTAYSNKHLPPWLFDLAREKGWCVVAPNYRLLVGGGKEGGLDAGDVLDDVLKAYECVVDGSLEMELEGRGEMGVRFDREKIAVVGMSAGGLLSLLLPTQLPPSLAKPTSLVALYPVARPFSLFYTTPRSSSTSSVSPPSTLPSLNLPSTFLAIADSLFTTLSSLPTTSSSPSLSPAEMRDLEQPGSDGHRGMIYDWSIERGVFGDLCLGKGVLGSKGKNDHDVDASLASTLDALQERLSPLIGINSPTRGTFPRTFLIHGDEDQLVLLEESRFVKARLEEVGIEVEMKVVEGVDHGFDGEMCLEGGTYEEIWREVGEWIEGSWGR